jgi:hypothetical protein
VPPIFQPEIIARAVVHLAEHPRRQMWLTARTTLAILGNMVAPGLLDRYLGRVGVDAQQTDEPVDPGRQTNLWEPVPGDHGAHGAFDARSRKRSPAVWASMHRRPLTAGGGALATAALLAAGARRVARH